jgi:hypothetical protein
MSIMPIWRIQIGCFHMTHQVFESDMIASQEKRKTAKSFLKFSFKAKPFFFFFFKKKKKSILELQVINMPSGPIEKSLLIPTQLS